MSTDKQWNILFIEDENSSFDSNSKSFEKLFNKVDKVSSTAGALKNINTNQYDFIIHDASQDVLASTTFLKQVKQMNDKQALVALVELKDEDKIGDMLEAGINAFVLSPDQFEQALEAIANLSL